MENLILIALDLALKSCAILAAAWLIALLMRRGSAAGRHLVWTLAVLSLLALPVLSYLLPGLAILPSAPMLAADEPAPVYAPIDEPEAEAPRGVTAEHAQDRTTEIATIPSPDGSPAPVPGPSSSTSPASSSRRARAWSSP